jgi:hypothetical protein
MSDASMSTNSVASRPLRKEERELIRFLLLGVLTEASLEDTLSVSLVTDMQDSGMGSIRFVHPKAQPFGRALMEAQYVDSDGVLVSIAVTQQETAISSRSIFGR